MGAHLRNPLAQAKAEGKPIVKVADIGDGLALAGCSVELAVDGEGNLCVLAFAIGGRPSRLVPMEPVKVLVGELAKIPMADFKKAIEEARPLPAPPPEDTH